MDMLMNWMGESFHTVYIYQTTLAYTFKILQFYVKYTSIKLIFKKYSRIVDYNKLFEKNKNNCILQVLLELSVVFTRGFIHKIMGGK